LSESGRLFLAHTIVMYYWLCSVGSASLTENSNSLS